MHLLRQIARILRRTPLHLHSLLSLLLLHHLMLLLLLKEMLLLLQVLLSGLRRLCPRLQNALFMSESGTTNGILLLSSLLHPLLIDCEPLRRRSSLLSAVLSLLWMRWHSSLRQRTDPSHLSSHGSLPYKIISISLLARNAIKRTCSLSFKLSGSRPANPIAAKL